MLNYFPFCLVPFIKLNIVLILKRRSGVEKFDRGFEAVGSFISQN